LRTKHDIQETKLPKTVKRSKNLHWQFFSGKCLQHWQCLYWPKHESLTKVPFGNNYQIVLNGQSKIHVVKSQAKNIDKHAKNHFSSRLGVLNKAPTELEYAQSMFARIWKVMLQNHILLIYDSATKLFSSGYPSVLYGEKYALSALAVLSLDVLYVTKKSSPYTSMTHFLNVNIGTIPVQFKLFQTKSWIPQTSIVWQDYYAINNVNYWRFIYMNNL
jgi:hypothetical protein